MPLAWLPVASAVLGPELEFKGFPIRSRLGLCALGVGAVAVLVMFDRRDRDAESDD